MPKTQPIKQADELTPKERPATAQRPGSKEEMSVSAVMALSENVFMVSELSGDPTPFKKPLLQGCTAMK